MSDAERSALLAARSLLYSFVSALFSPPGSEQFEMLRTEELQTGVLSSSKYLDASLNSGSINLEPLVRKIFVALPKTGQRIEEKYGRLFGHTLSKETAPYEIEHMKTKEVFALTQGLADIQGFYRAFGVEVDSGERADHIAIESEFLSYLILKESLAVENQQSENAEVCSKAQKDFWKDHFSWWTPRLAKELQQQADGFYNLASDFLSRFLEVEGQLLAN